MEEYDLTASALDRWMEIFHKNRKAYGTRKLKVALQERGVIVSRRRDREFEQKETRRFVVSDLTYVKVGQRWHYVCVLIDLFNREIIGHGAGPAKDVALISRAFATVEGDLSQIQWFHTDRSSEFNNQTMEQLLKTFDVGRSLSKKGCPYDNAVAEATYMVMKTEFIYRMEFQSLLSV